MSTTDQAFMRAYRDPAAKPCAPAAGNASQAVAKMPPRAPVKAASAESTVVEIGWNQTRLESFATIHVGISPTIPPPHADFSGGLQSLKTAANLPAKSAGDRFAQSPKGCLSSFTATSQTAPDAPKPALEVDEVRWPAICKALLASQATAFASLRIQLQGDLDAGRKVVAITGAARGEGCTTLALCLAKNYTAAGVKVALMDADFASPQIAPQLGLGIETGWESALEGRNGVWDVMIESKADRLAILPLRSCASVNAAANSAFRAATDLHELREQYEIVIVDAGPMASGSPAERWLQPGSGIDGWIVVHDARSGSAAALASLTLRLADARQVQLGFAEMFVGS